MDKVKVRVKRLKNGNYLVTEATEMNLIELIKKYQTLEKQIDQFHETVQEQASQSKKIKKAIPIMEDANNTVLEILKKVPIADKRKLRKTSKIAFDVFHDITGLKIEKEKKISDKDIEAFDKDE